MSLHISDTCRTTNYETYDSVFDRLSMLFFCFYSIILYPLFYILTSFSLRVIICKTLKKKGRAFRNIGFKYTQFSTFKSALLLFRFYILSLIRSFTIGSGTSFLLRWSLQTLNLSMLMTNFHYRHISYFSFFFFADSLSKSPQLRR